MHYMFLQNLQGNPGLAPQVRCRLSPPFLKSCEQTLELIHTLDRLSFTLTDPTTVAGVLGHTVTVRIQRVSFKKEKY